jgi:hypothetical protein
MLLIAVPEGPLMAISRREKQLPVTSASGVIADEIS